MAIDRDPPDRARCVIIGGGVGGVSIAYHLAELGYEDVVLVERSQLTSGSTFHSAGLVGQTRGSVSLTKMMMHSVELYRRIGDESEFDPGWVECGGIKLASSEERMEELRRQAGWAKTFGLPLELISPEEAKEKFPLMSTDGVLGAAWLPTDGYLDPSQLTYALADGARRGGVRIFTSTRVTGIEVSGERVQAVETDRGRIECEVVVNASGMYAAGDRPPGRGTSPRHPDVPPVCGDSADPRALGRRAAPHPAGSRPPRVLPRRRRRVGHGRLRARLEAGLPPRGTDDFDEIPPDFNGRLLEDEPDRFEEIAENSKIRVPAMKDAKITKLINGPEAFTPDNEFCLGETDVAGFFVAAGFCAHGLAGAGGIGMVMAEWISEGEPSLDLWSMDVRRFGAHYRSPGLHARSHPGELRDLLRHPLPEPRARGGATPARLTGEWVASRARRRVRREVRLGAGQLVRVERRAGRRSRFGRADGPACTGRRRSAPSTCATRETAALFDESSFAKMEISGRGAAEFVEGLCDNRVARGVGQITYTQMLNSRGGIECDFTVARLAEERFSIVTGTAFGRHDRGWITSHLPADGSVQVHDMTSAYACFGIWGPRARDILQPLVPQDLGNEAFPYMTLQDITVGHVPVRALRVTYVGELGWELYCPTEYGLGLWRALWEAGEPHGMVAGGYRAIDSLRVEKGYRVWGADITPDETPYEGSVGFCVKLDKDGGFIGRDALVEAKEPRA